MKRKTFIRRRVLQVLEPISNRYDPERDMIPDGPKVTWAEYNLMRAVYLMLEAIEDTRAAQADLQDRIKDLEAAAGLGVLADDPGTQTHE